MKDTKNTFYPERIRALHNFDPKKNSNDDKPVVPAKIFYPPESALRDLIKILKKNNDMPVCLLLLSSSSALFSRWDVRSARKTLKNSLKEK